MKKRLLPLLSLVFCVGTLVSCGSTYEIAKIGQFNMVSTKNIDSSKDYAELKNYAGVSGSDIEAAMKNSKLGIIKKKSKLAIQINELKAESLDQGIDKVVRNVPGGTYMTNIIVYKVTETGSPSPKLKGEKTAAPEVSEYYIVSGDVWGIKKDDVNIRGFHQGDKVVVIDNSELKKAGLKVSKDDQIKGEITELQGVKAMVKLGEEFDYKIVAVSYSSLTKAN